MRNILELVTVDVVQSCRYVICKKKKEKEEKNE